jgi:hypothetical protein
MSIALEDPELRTRAVAEPAMDPVYGPLYRLSVEQYLEAVRLGVLTEDDRAELLEGVLVAKMGKNPPHVVATKLLCAALARILPAGWHVAKEDPLRTEDSVLEPNVAAGSAITPAASPRPVISASSSRSPNPASPAIGASSCGPTPERTSPSTGSSTWSIAGLRSTPTRPAPPIGRPIAWAGRSARRANCRSSSTAARRGGSPSGTCCRKGRPTKLIAAPHIDSAWIDRPGRRWDPAAVSVLV